MAVVTADTCTSLPCCCLCLWTIAVTVEDEEEVAGSLLDSTVPVEMPVIREEEEQDAC